MFFWALPKGRAFRTRFLFVPHKRAQTNASIANAGLLAVLFTTRNQIETLFLQDAKSPKYLFRVH